MSTDDLKAMPPIEPAYPSTPAEVTNAMVHYYRGELGRMSGWRDRIDRTSTWAITATAAMLSLSLSSNTAHHGVLIFAMMLVTLLLLVESRRYRFYDVFRDRVRIIERHYFGQVFGPSPEPKLDWTRVLADSLREPRFSITYIDAMAHRLRRTYGWIYLILLLAWALKISSAWLQPAGVHQSWREPFDNMLISAALGPLPGLLVIAGVLVFYGFLAWLAAKRSPPGETALQGEVRV